MAGGKPFEEGNQLYKFRLKDGKYKKYTIDEWLNKVIEYFEYMSTSVWLKNEAIKSGDMAGQCMQVKASTPLTRDSLAVFAGIHKTTIDNYASNKEGYEGYFDITNHALDIIDMNLKDGALLGFYNANLVARLQGIKDQTENINKNENTNVNYDHLTAEEIKDILGK